MLTSIPHPQDDEPADGPSCYCLLTGFTSAEVFQHLTALKLTAHALVRVKGQEETYQTASEYIVYVSKTAVTTYTL